jgi:hypothetical protein
MPKGRLYDREGLATMGRQNLETRWVEKLACHYLCLLAISNRCSKDSSCAHKGLVTNWPHHSRLPTAAKRKEENTCLGKLLLNIQSPQKPPLMWELRA